MTADFPELFSPIIAFTPLLNCNVIPSSSKALKFFIVSFSIYILSPRYLKISLIKSTLFYTVIYPDKTEICLSPD